MEYLLISEVDQLQWTMCYGICSLTVASAAEVRIRVVNNPGAISPRRDH